MQYTVREAKTGDSVLRVLHYCSGNKHTLLRRSEPNIMLRLKMAFSYKGTGLLLMSYFVQLHMRRKERTGVIMKVWGMMELRVCRDEGGCAFNIGSSTRKHVLFLECQ
jgi:hypothetical protein